MNDAERKAIRAWNKEVKAGRKPTTRPNSADTGTGRANMDYPDKRDNRNRRETPNNVGRGKRSR
jgi:hypothetical protein